MKFPAPVSFEIRPPSPAAEINGYMAFRASGLRALCDTTEDGIAASMIIMESLVGCSIRIGDCGKGLNTPIYLKFRNVSNFLY